MERSCLPRVILNPGRDHSIRRFHPWVFSGAVSAVEGKATEGDIVDVISAEGDWLARAHYYEGDIALKILSFRDVPIDQQFWNDSIRNAYALRELLKLTANPDTNAYRLVHGEGDGLPGLVIDVYAEAIVVQYHTVGMRRASTQISAAIAAQFPHAHLIIEHDREGEGVESESATTFCEHGIQYVIDHSRMQKTGFFLDQRENRALLRTLASGRRVLDAFCYTGGFSLAALAGGAQMVHGVDRSEHALKHFRENMERNFPTAEFHCFAMDFRDFLGSNNRERYDLIVLDPPAFAKHRRATTRAVRAYSDLNFETLSLLKPGGILFTFSCSQVVDRATFREAIGTAMVRAKRTGEILYQLSQAPCHPIASAHPEGEYLKGLVIRVD